MTTPFSPTTYLYMDFGSGFFFALLSLIYFALRSAEKFVHHFFCFYVVLPRKKKEDICRVAMQLQSCVSAQRARIKYQINYTPNVWERERRESSHVEFIVFNVYSVYTASIYSVLVHPILWITFGIFFWTFYFYHFVFFPFGGSLIFFAKRIITYLSLNCVYSWRFFFFDATYMSHKTAAAQTSISQSNLNHLRFEWQCICIISSFN